jgi:hypothetical protein
MARYAATFKDLGLGRLSPGSAMLILIALTLLLATSQAQEVTRPLAMFPTDCPGTPGPLRRVSPVQLQGHLHYNSPLVFDRFPAGNYPRSHFLNVAPDAGRLVVNSRAMPLMSNALWNQEKYSMGRNSRNSEALAFTYRTAPSATQRTTLDVGQYLRHIPTAGPMMMRIYVQAKAHPRLTRALSMIRPDF